MIIAVDFDGTLCTNAWPEIGEPNMDLIRELQALKRQGHTLILWTNRCGKELMEAVYWCAEYELLFDLVNENHPERVRMYGSESRKISADLYIDDKAAPVWSDQVGEWSNNFAMRKIAQEEEREIKRIIKQKEKERAAAERAAAETWELSEREKEIIRDLGEKKCLKK